MAELFNDFQLINNNGRIVDGYTILQNKVVGIYFVALDSSYGEYYTPIITQFYDEIIKMGKEFTIVVAMAEQEKEEFEIFLQMIHDNWWIIPCENIAKKQSKELTKEYDVNPVSSLVIFDRTCKIMTKSACQDIGIKLPWTTLYDEWLTNASYDEKWPTNLLTIPRCGFVANAPFDNAEIFKLQLSNPNSEHGLEWSAEVVYGKERIKIENPSGMIELNASIRIFIHRKEFEKFETIETMKEKINFEDVIELRWNYTESNNYVSYKNITIGYNI